MTTTIHDQWLYSAPVVIFFLTWLTDSCCHSLVPDPKLHSCTSPLRISKVWLIAVLNSVHSHQNFGANQIRGMHIFVIIERLVMAHRLTCQLLRWGYTAPVCECVCVVCVCVCVCAYVCVHVCARVYVCIHVYVCAAHTHTHTHTQHTHTHTHTRQGQCNPTVEAGKSAHVP